MKRLWSIMLVIILVVSLASCGKKFPQTSPYENGTEEFETFENKSFAEEEIEETVTPMANIKWQSQSMVWTNKNGYTFRATIKVTPWMFWTDPRIESIWNQISNEPERLPRTFSDWGLTNYGSTKITTSSRDIDFAFQPPSGVTGLYYLMGTIEVENITEGWDITEETRQSERIYLSPGGKEEPCMWMAMPCKTPFITKFFYTNETKTQDSFLIADMGIRTNHWGPAPFVMACAENFSPKFPDGECYEWIEKYLACNALGDGDGRLISIPLEKDIVR